MLSVLSKLFQLTPYATSASQEISRHITNIAKITATAIPCFEKKKEERGFLADLVSSVANSFKYPFYEGFLNETKESHRSNIQALKNLGAKEDFLTSKDGAKIHYLHAKGKDFQEHIQKANGEFAEIILQNGKKIAAIAIPKNKNAEQLCASLAHILGGAPPFKTFLYDDKAFLLPENDLAEVKKELESNKKAWKEHLLNYTSKPYQPTAVKGSVVICDGIGSQVGTLPSTVQTFFYLMQGYENVVTFSYRGAGKSKGIISEEGFDADLEKIHAYLKYHGVKNEDLLLQGTCFGSGPATRFAKNHKGVNLRLFTPYASSQQLAKDIVNMSNSSRLSKEIQKAYVGGVGCNYNVQSDLKEVTGNVHYVLNRTDETVSGEHDLANLKALGIKDPLKKHIVVRDDKIVQLSYVEGISHANPWYSKVQGDINWVCKFNGLKKRVVSIFTDEEKKQKQYSMTNKNKEKVHISLDDELAEMGDGWLDLSSETSFKDKGVQSFITFDEKANLGTPIFKQPIQELEVIGDWKKSALQTSEVVPSLLSNYLNKLSPGNISNYLDGFVVAAVRGA